jgi:hypothetical protein
MKNVLVSALTAALVMVCFYVLRPAEASRNSSGTDSAINGPFVAGTVISSSAINARFADAETELTSSLDRSGRGGMLAALRGIDGTKAAPAFSWTSEVGSGLYRNGTNDVRMSVNATDAVQFTPTGVLVPVGITSAPLVITGAGQTSASVSTSSTLGGALSLTDTSGSAGNGGLLLFGASQGRFASIKGFITDGANNTSGEIGFATRTASANATLTEKFRVTSGGISGDTAGFKHKRFGSSCATLAVAGNTCTSTLTWVTAYPDANYTVVCTGQGPAGQPILSLNTHVAASATINVTATTAVISSFTEVDCVAVHD